MLNLLWTKVKESLLSVLPITVLIVIMNFAFLHIPTLDLVAFLFGFVLLVFGVSLFSLGADISMIPMGRNLSSTLMKKKNLTLLLISSFLIGFLITIAEPDLMVLAEKFPSLNKWVLIIAVGIGVGLFLMISTWRVVYKIHLKWILIIGYIAIFGFAIIMHFIDESFVTIAFDSGGVTTGPITVPFIIAFGLGLSESTKKSGGKDGDESFGAVAICSMGPIISILILKVFLQALGQGGAADSVDNSYVPIASMNELWTMLGNGLINEVHEVGVPILMIVALFIVYHAFLLKIDKKSLIIIYIGLFNTLIGLVLFLAGAKIGFMNIGTFIGETFGKSDYSWLLIPLGGVIGFVVVLAEPSVHVLTKQVEDITNGSISKTKILICLACGVGIAIALAMTRIIFDLSIWLFIVPGYLISVVLIFFVPEFFTSIAFDSGGVASGPLTSTFILPLSMGVCSILYASNPDSMLINSFGVVALVAMTPLITIQLLGLNYKIKTDRLEKAMKALIVNDESDDIIITFNSRKKVK